MKKIAVVAIAAIALTFATSFLASPSFNNRESSADGCCDRGFALEGKGFPFSNMEVQCSGQNGACHPISLGPVPYIANFIVYFLILLALAWIANKLFKRNSNNAI